VVGGQDSTAGKEQETSSDIVTSSEMERAFATNSIPNFSPEASPKNEMETLIEALEAGCRELGGSVAGEEIVQPLKTPTSARSNKTSSELGEFRSKLAELEDLNKRLLTAVKDLLGVTDDDPETVLEMWTKLKEMESEEN
jgi:hypothetical protein